MTPILRPYQVAGLAAVEARGLLETARKYLDFVPQSSLPVLKGGSRSEVE